MRGEVMCTSEKPRENEPIGHRGTSRAHDDMCPLSLTAVASCIKIITIEIMPAANLASFLKRRREIARSVDGSKMLIANARERNKLARGDTPFCFRRHNCAALFVLEARIAREAKCIRWRRSMRNGSL